MGSIPAVALSKGGNKHMGIGDKADNMHNNGLALFPPASTRRDYE
jgi:hypothetical protein